MQLDRPETNEVRALTMVPIYAESDSRSRLEPNPAGGPGRYEVVFVLGIPGSDTFHESLDLAALEAWGDSLIVTGRSDIVEVRVELIPGEGTSQLPEIRIKTNGQGALAQARVSVEAQDFDSAQRLAYDVVAPLLSRWCFELDVAIEINGFHATELATGSMRYTFGWAGKRRILNPERVGPVSIGPESRYLATYREALNSTNIFHQAITFYKVTEGVQRRRAVRREQAKNQGEAIPRSPVERFPSDPEQLSISDQLARDLFAPYLGRSFGDALYKMRATIRNAGAHLDPKEDVLNADDYKDLANCRGATPVLHYIAREMLRNEFPSMPAPARSTRLPNK